MNYLVTGGVGFIGNNIVRLLLESGHNVDIIDNLHVGKIENIKDITHQINFFEIDIRDKANLQKIIKNYDGIFHEAALTAVPESFEKPEEYRDVNVVGTKNIFDIANRENIRVVYASSSSVYGNTIQIPITEEFEKKPINPYGQTKLDDEILAEKFEELSVIGLRYFNVYGIGQNISYAGVITKFLEQIKNKKPLAINGNGNQVRDFIHVKDIAKANLVSMESNVKKGFFNVGTGISTSINDLAKMMIELSDNENEIIHGLELEGDIESSQADIEFTKKSINWNYSIDLKEGLTELIQNTVNFYKSDS
jgi:UDP-glucose 4-epimerase